MFAYFLWCLTCEGVNTLISGRQASTSMYVPSMGTEAFLSLKTMATRLPVLMSVLSTMSTSAPSMLWW